MYYDRLKRKIEAYKAQEPTTQEESDIIEHIAPSYNAIHADIKEGRHTVYNLTGGRGSGKSSFIALEIVAGIMADENAAAIIFRRTAATLRDSVFYQIAWAVDTLGASSKWRGSVSPLQWEYMPTGQKISFRGADDAEKVKSIKPRKGYYKYIWFEEFNEFQGARTVRNLLQSTARGGDKFIIFNSFNPPLSVNNWANKYILEPNDRATLFRTTYKDLPHEWLGMGFIEEAERLREINPNAYKHEYLGEPIDIGGEVFPNLEARTITDEEIAEIQYIYCGLDWGFSVDPTAFIRLSYDRKKEHVFLLDEIYQKHMSNKDIEEAIKARGYDTTAKSYLSPIYGNTGDERQLIICDSAEPKSIADLKKAGLKCIPCKKYAGSVQYGIKWLQRRKIIIDPKRTPNAWREFSEYEYLTTKDGDFLADVPDKDNHTIDAARYALDRIINNSKYEA